MKMTNKEIIVGTITMEGKHELLSFFIKEQLLTFAEWKKRGYCVKKGETASIQVPLWKKVEYKCYKTKEDKNRFISKKASLFTFDQVQSIK